HTSAGRADSGRIKLPHGRGGLPSPGHPPPLHARPSDDPARSDRYGLGDAVTRSLTLPERIAYREVAELVRVPSPTIPPPRGSTVGSALVPRTRPDRRRGRPAGHLAAPPQ